MEFKTEIELLSRVHHNNLVSLMGFCFAEGEQMLVYEYVANGTLKDAVSGTCSFKVSHYLFVLINCFQKCKGYLCAVWTIKKENLRYLLCNSLCIII